MRRWFLPVSLGAAAIAAASLVFSPNRSAAAPAVVSNGTPVLLELFTSEGCSSCPPADAVAARLEHDQPVAGARVIVLAHHVDYWDSLGWPDPWSSAAATARQRSYGGRYTPQALIDGQADVVGSRGADVAAAIAEAAKRAHAKVDVDVVRAGDGFDVSVRAPAEDDVVIAVVQDRGRVDVPRGENAGKTLDHTSIVRSLVIGSRAHVALPKPIAAPDGTTFSVVAFAQERGSRHVLGASSAPLR